MKVLVTGATGFVGRALVPMLRAEGWTVRATGRNASLRPADCEFLAADLTQGADLGSLVRGMDAVVHLSGRAHVMRERSADAVLEFRNANVSPTASLADAARKSGVRHFVFASSIKVNGEETGAESFTEADVPAPGDAYAASKLEAEQALQERADGAFCITVLRPPLMYGAGAKGNFARLLRCVESGIPLPLASVRNRRSLLYVGNFCSAILAAVKRPAGGTRLYLLSDGEALSTPDLVRRMADAVSKPARVFPFPVGLLRGGAALAGFGPEMRRLTGSLVVYDARIRGELGWNPPFSIEQGLALTAKAP